MDTVPRPKPNAPTASTKLRTPAGGPGGASARPPGPTPPRGRRPLVIALVAGLLALGGGVLLTRGTPDAPPTGITTVIGEGQPFGGGAFLSSDEQVTDEQWRQRAAAFEAFRVAGPVPLDRAREAEALAYIDQTPQPPARKAEIKAAVQQKAVEMVAVGFFDDCDIDGDAISVSAGGTSITVPLGHEVQYVLVPMPQGGTAEIAVTGIKDGTGGITIGVVTPSGTVNMPRLSPGQQTTFQAR